MTDSPADRGISTLVRPVPMLAPHDTVRRASGLIRASDGSALLVARDSSILGSISERAIAAYIAGAEDSERALDDPIEQLIDASPVFVNSSVSAGQAAGVFASTGVDMLPVIDSLGSFRGVLYRRDVVGLLTRNLRPPTVAGMATPLGVYLTTGSHRSGAGSLGLFLTGLSMFAMILIATLAVQGLQQAFAAMTGIRVDVYMASTPLTLKPNIYDLAFYISTALTIIIVLLLLRISPLSGYHAAEHMTVHAIEVGEALTPEAVRGMPRVHPRCGTNLLAGAGIFLVLATKVGSELTVLLALVVVVLGWRSVGGWLQYLVTTKDPSERQLANGIAAGNELLQRYQDHPHYQVTGFDRIWSMGFLQTASGMAAGIGMLSVVQWAFNFRFLQGVL